MFEDIVLLFKWLISVAINMQGILILFQNYYSFSSTVYNFIILYKKVKRSN